MPTHTPSPHRFLAHAPPSTQKGKPKPQSSLRHVQLQTPTSTRQASFSVQTPQSELQFKTPTPANRFVITPTQYTRNAEQSNGDETVTSRLKLRRKPDRIESIEEAQSIPAKPADDEHGVIRSIEEALQEDHPSSPLDDEMLFEPSLPKRRRLSSPPHRFRFLPQTPALISPLSTSAATSSQTTPATTATTAPHKPHFILPPLPKSPHKPSKPLIEIFSPSRKNAKYTPGGLASTVQGWIIETANTGENRGGVVWGRDRTDGVKLRVRVTGVSGRGDEEKNGKEDETEGEVKCVAGAVVFIRGEADAGLNNSSRTFNLAGEDGEMRVLLAGQGGTRGAVGVTIRVGELVGIRAPMWDVFVGDEKWLVSVDWVVL